MFCRPRSVVMSWFWIWVPPWWLTAASVNIKTYLQWHFWRSRHRSVQHVTCWAPLESCRRQKSAHQSVYTITCAQARVQDRSVLYDLQSTSAVLMTLPFSSSPLVCCPVAPISYRYLCNNWITILLRTDFSSIPECKTRGLGASTKLQYTQLNARGFNLSTHI